MLSLDPNPYLLETGVHLGVKALPAAERCEVLVRRRAEIPPDFLELVGDIGHAYGRITIPRHPSDTQPQTYGPHHLTLLVFGRDTLEHLVAAVRRVLPGASVTARRTPGSQGSPCQAPSQGRRES